MLTFLISGLWHGASWTFVLWGALHGFALVAEKAAGYDGKRHDSKIKKGISWFVVFVFCNIAWVFFRAETFADAFSVLGKAFGFAGNISGFFYTASKSSVKHMLFVAIVLLIVTVFDYCSQKTDLTELAAKRNRVIVLAVQYAILGMIVVALFLGTGTNQFVYFQF